MSIKTIGIIGNGKFGRLLHELLSASNNLVVRIYDRKSKETSNIFADLQWVLNADLIFPCVPISQIRNLAEQIQEKKWGVNSVFVDVASVKEYPINIYKQFLPSAQVIASHPMFGPGNFDDSLPKLEQVKQLKLNTVISNISADYTKYVEVQDLLRSLGLNLIEMSPKDHDRISAKSQFITLTNAFILKKYNFSRTVIDTRSAKVLSSVLEMITIDIGLLKDMYRYNSYCSQELSAFKESIENTINRITEL